eukprot:5593983-Pleurochrysis_carterae.AAC.1
MEMISPLPFAVALTAARYKPLHIHTYAMCTLEHTLAPARAIARVHAHSSQHTRTLVPAYPRLSARTRSRTRSRAHDRMTPPRSSRATRRMLIAALLTVGH